MHPLKRVDLALERLRHHLFDWELGFLKRTRDLFLRASLSRDQTPASFPAEPYPSRSSYPRLSITSLTPLPTDRRDRGSSDIPCSPTLGTPLRYSI
jgi:hypothetical protein